MSKDPAGLLQRLEAAKRRTQDDAVKLTIADLLEQRGADDRAEFVRLQISQSRLPWWEAVRKDSDMFLGQHLEEWMGIWLDVGKFERF